DSASSSLSIGKVTKRTTKRLHKLHVLTCGKVAHLVGDGEHAASDRAASGGPFRLDIGDRHVFAA
ncbi:MAG: hypothetical protein ACREDO_05850, partial [Methyloceanibacter sp.]